MFVVNAPHFSISPSNTAAAAAAERSDGAGHTAARCDEEEDASCTVPTDLQDINRCTANRLERASAGK
ncbi:hypothetical protein ABVT39_020954 [Epinephelus coioides]